MSTEDLNPRYFDLDQLSAIEQLGLLHESQAEAIAAVQPALPAIAAAVEVAAQRLRRGGRLVYCGAGTSARIGVQDGAELLPTFSWPADKVEFVVAGGEKALLRAVENAEDSAEDGAEQIAKLGLGPDDVVLGIAASGNTPFTVAAVQTARRLGALTIGVANNAGSRLLAESEHPILVDTGPEAVAGSTRLKAGTAQKIVLNLFSTAVMIQLGRVYAGLMVEMQPTNAKLRQRAEQMVVKLTGCDAAIAAHALARSGGKVKLAVLVVAGVDVADAMTLLERSGGSLRAALAAVRVD
jgi:N-acetylmuramic acid 6-phosphate etherase